MLKPDTPFSRSPSLHEKFDEAKKMIIAAVTDEVKSFEVRR